VDEEVATGLLGLKVLQHADHLQRLGLEGVGEVDVDDARASGATRPPRRR
jgi:hypothetical protein